MNHIEAAFKAARAAGEIQLKYFNSEFKIETKSTDFDLVTVADLESEAAIIEIIKSEFPDHNFLAEENKYLSTDSDYTWIIDPLDGTNNFAYKLPIFCSSIALAYKSDLILGVIYDPTRDELFYAEKGKGAFLNGKPINVSAQKTLKNSLLITGFYYDRGQDMRDTLDNIETFFKAGILGVRRLGSAALDLCFVASGRASGFWEFSLSPWDYAAGKLILEEAGGVLTDKGGFPVDFYQPSYIVASNGLIQAEILKNLR